MGRMGARARDARGQSTVEAAVALPVVFLLVLLLVQPGIVLYDRMVMAGAAAEGCRLLATSDGDAATCEEYVRRRLGAIPPLDVFRVHDSGCTWEVRCEGGGAADAARVTVRTVNERGNLVVEVTATSPTRASWAQESLDGASVNGKAGEWRHEG